MQSKIQEGWLDAGGILTFFLLHLNLFGSIRIFSILPPFHQFHHVAKALLPI
jgi:hypothetical protein